MKNIKKIGIIVCAIMIVMTAVLTGISKVSAAGTTITVNQEGIMKSFIGTEQDGFRWAKYRTADGIVAYCMDINKKWPESSLSMTLTGEADAGIKYILENGYPNKKIYDKGDVDRFITQGAIWWYLSDKGQGDVSEVLTKTGAESVTGMREKMQALVNGAKGAKDSSTTVDMNLSVDSTEMTLSEDKKYYVSSEFTVKLVGASTYKVSVNGVEGATAVATDGSVKEEFNANEKFVVRFSKNSISKTTSLSVNVSANGQVTKAATYKPANDEMQRVVALTTENVPVEKSVNLTANVEPGKPSVCVDYVIVGNVIPDPELTDPTPGKSCYDKGTKYTQEKKLTTRQKSCKFVGWNTKSDLTGTWTDGTALNKDMTLYGAWDCGSTPVTPGTTINVPSTGANTPIAMIAGGIIIIAGGFGVYFLRSKKLSNVK